MTEQNSINAEELAIKARNFIASKRGFTNSNTKDLFEKTIRRLHSSELEESEFATSLCSQLSSMTGMPYIDWAEEMFPLNLKGDEDFFDVFKKLSIFLTAKEKMIIDLTSQNLENPIHGHSTVSNLEHMLEVETPNQKWALLAELASKGCVYSSVALGNLFLPLSEADPTVSENHAIAETLLSHALTTLKSDSDNEHHLAFESRFNTLLCETKLKLAILWQNTNKKAESEELILSVWKHAPHYSRTRRYIKDNYHNIILDHS